MTIPYLLSESPEQSGLTAIIDGQVKAVNNSHPNWDAIVNLVRQPDANPSSLMRLIDPAEIVSEFFNALSERVSVSNGHLFVDGDEVNDALGAHILRYIDEGNDPTPLVNFLEKVLTNPNEHSREQLYTWLDRHQFTINDDGNFLAYKGVVQRDGDDSATYPYQSSSRGKAIVDGQAYEGAIPNGVGAVVEMSRSDVQHDPSVGCHTGLHAGTWDYASTFTNGPTLLVEVNPRDVVSVPSDCEAQKLRTCRYTVVDVVDAELDSTYYSDELDEDVSFDEDEPVGYVSFWK